MVSSTSDASTCLERRDKQPTNDFKTFPEVVKTCLASWKHAMSSEKFLFTEHCWGAGKKWD